MGNMEAIKSMNNTHGYFTWFSYYNPVQIFWQLASLALQWHFVNNALIYCNEQEQLDILLAKVCLMLVLKNLSSWHKSVATEWTIVSLVIIQTDFLKKILHRIMCRIFAVDEAVALTVPQRNQQEVLGWDLDQQNVLLKILPQSYMYHSTLFFFFF